MKPVIEAEQVPPEELSAIHFDEISVTFKEGVTRPDVDAIILPRGMSVLRHTPTRNDYLFKLPVDITVEDAVEFFHDRSDVRLVIPNFSVEPSETIPDDPYWTDQWQFTRVEAQNAWDITTGHRRVVLAVVDLGFDMDHPDFLYNIWINQRELPPSIFDVEPAGALDGVVTDADITALDTDADDIISFVDLNDPAFALNAPGLCLGGIAPLDCDVNGDGVVTPFDLVDGDGSIVYGFEDGADNDDNTYYDDIVGWDFGLNPLDELGDNLPDYGRHGINVAGVLGAVSNNSLGIAGMNWSSSVMVIEVADDFGENSLFAAFSYAAENGALAINASWAVVISRGATPCPESSQIIENTGSDKFNFFKSDLTRRFDLADVDGIPVVAGTKNCRYDLDASGYWEFPSEINRPEIIAVTGTNIADGHTGERAFGIDAVDIAAPSYNFRVLDEAGGYGVGAGNSLAAPLVTGTLGLVLDVCPGLWFDITGLRSAILDNAEQELPTLLDYVHLGRLLNTNNTILYSCP